MKEETRATTIHLHTKDLEMFQTIPELKRTMGPLAREFLHNYLSTNGFSDIDIERQIREQHEVQREANKKIYTLEMQRRENIERKYSEGKELLDEGTMERIIGDMIEDLIHDNYNRYKNALRYSADAELKPKVSWLKNRMKPLTDMPGFDKTPKEMQDMILDITENLREQWDKGYEQEREKHMPRERKF